MKNNYKSIKIFFQIILDTNFYTMKTLILNICLLLIFLIIACKPVSIPTSTLYTSKNDSIIIRGQITVENSGLPPQGLVTINIKNSWKWANGKIKGENNRVFANKKGEYEIHIKKGDTLTLIANTKLYKREAIHTTNALYQSQNIDFQLTKNNEALENTKQNFTVYNNLIKHIKNVNPDSLITIKGTVINRYSKKPIKSVLIMQPWVYNTDNYLTFNLTDSLGKFSMQIPKEDLITINSLDKESQRIILYPKKDTIVNIVLPIITN